MVLYPRPQTRTPFPWSNDCTHTSSKSRPSAFLLSLINADVTDRSFDAPNKCVYALRTETRSETFKIVRSFRQDGEISTVRCDCGAHDGCLRLRIFVVRLPWIFFLFPELLEDSRALRILLSLSPKCPCFLKRELPKFLLIILSGQPNYNGASTMIVNSEEGIYIEISKVQWGEYIIVGILDNLPSN